MSKGRAWIFLFTLFVLVATQGFYAENVYAQSARSYEYASIDYTLEVEHDTTVKVTETQTYDFNGTYHQGVRFIPKDKISSISDIFVADASGELLERSLRRLDKTDPSSWGKFTTYTEGGAYYIEWYYDAANTTSTWELHYTLHGALSFLSEIDELYWDLFDSYDVPIRRLSATVTLPENTYSSDEYQLQLYTVSSFPKSAEITEDKRFVFSALNVPPGEPVTIAAGWPRGIVDRGAYWRELAASNWGLGLSFPLIFLTLTYLLLYWYRSEVQYKGKRTIVPEYEPPKGLTPAMMDVIVNEHTTDHTWPATVVDLAVRGYIKILEEKETLPNRSEKVARFLIFAIAPVLGILYAAMVLTSIKNAIVSVLVVVVAFSIGRRLFFRITWNLKPKDYVLERVFYGDSKEEGLKEQYEKVFLDIIFRLSKTFSTQKMRSASMQSVARNMYKKMKKLEEKLLTDTASETLSYVVQPIRRKYLHFVWIGIALIMFFAPSFLSGLQHEQLIIVLLSVFVSALLIYAQHRLNPRLNIEGNRLREQCLGFKLYLKTAERDRLQNLTPQMFEKYLPYAIVFGVEKKWANAFRSIHVAPPSWYVGGGYISSGNISGGGFSVPSFSASAFSASFSSSFSSAFSSSAGGGASGGGGGGGAGGGGGGGGGGAS